MHQGFAGVWQWQLAWGAPGRLRLILRTDAEPQRMELDGERVRTWLGGAQVSEEALAQSGVGALLRFAALSNLDALLAAERVAWQELPAAELLPGEARGLSARFLDAPGASFALGFDAALRLVRLVGPVAIPGLGEGQLEARYRDYRRAARRQLPFAIDYRFRGAPLLEERVLSWQRDAWL